LNLSNVERRKTKSPPSNLLTPGHPICRTNKSHAFHGGQFAAFANFTFILPGKRHQTKQSRQLTGNYLKRNNFFHPSPHLGRINGTNPFQLRKSATRQGR
jgi:hypothetical protein